MWDTTNLLLTFAGLNGALTCLTLWKISQEETKRGRKLAWNLPFRNARARKRGKQGKKPTRARARVHANQNKKWKNVKPRSSQKEVEILPPQHNLPQDDRYDEESPYLEGEWKVIE